MTTGPEAAAVGSAVPGMLSVEEALQRVLEGLDPAPVEHVALGEALDRVLAEDLTARLTQPPFDASAMDGYALRAADAARVPATLKVIGTSAAGHPFEGVVGPGEAVRIFTGGELPEGADAVVIQEDTEAEGNRVTIREAPVAGQHVRPAGFDFRRGEVLLRSGRKLGPRDLALAAAMNHGAVPVRRKPKVAILATGDELVPVGEEPGPGQIISSVPHGLAPLVARAGGQPELLGIACDERRSLAEHLGRADDAELVVTIGGASVGDHDLVQDALLERGVEMGFWKIAMRPGKPLMYGRRGAQRFIGLPGNPVSALICTRIFIVPMLERMLALSGAPAGEMTVTLGAAVAKNGPRQQYMRATLTCTPSGERVATPVETQDSSLLSALAKADCLIVRPPHAAALEAGAAVSALPLDF